MGEDRVEQLAELDALLGGQLLLPDEPGVLDEQRALERHALDHAQAVAVEAPVVRDDEHDRAEGRAPGQQRHDGERLDAEPLPDVPRLLGGRDEVDQVLAQALVDLRAAAREQLGRPRRPSGVENGWVFQSSSIELGPAGSRWAAATRRMRPSGSRSRTVPQSATAGTIRSSTSARARSGSRSVASIRDTSARRSASSGVEAVRRAARSPYGPVIHGRTVLARHRAESLLVEATDLKVVRYEVDGRVAVVTLDRPDRLNAWTGRMHTEYRWCLAQAEADPDVRAVVVTGAGRGFCAGADTAALDGHVQAGRYDPGTPDELARPGYGVRAEYDHAFAFHFGMRLPVIAAVNGPAAGVGLVLACYCDVRFAAEGAKLTTSAGRLGLPAEYGLSWVLPRLVGIGHAADLLISSRVVGRRRSRQDGAREPGPPPGRSAPGRRSSTRRTSPRPSRRRRPAPPRRSSTPTSTATSASRCARSEALLEQMVRGPDFAEGVAAWRDRRVPEWPATGPDERAGRRRHPGARRGPTSPSAPSPTTGPGRSSSTASPGGPRCPRCGAASSRELPELVRPRKVPPGLRVVTRGPPPRRRRWPRGPLIDRRQGGSVSRAGISRRLRVAAEALGPTYIKLGQIISSGEGIFPAELVVEFKKCRDQVPPEPFAGGPRGRRGRPRPAARARCSRRSSGARSPPRRSPRSTRPPCVTGEEVVVKVQRPPVGRLVQPGPPGHGVARAATSSAASRSPRWPTRRRWSSCSPRRSPRSSTSGSRPRTCSTSPASSPSSASGATSSPARTPTLVTPPGAGDGAAVGLRLRRRARACRRPASTPRPSCAPG